MGFEIGINIAALRAIPSSMEESAIF